MTASSIGNANSAFSGGTLAIDKSGTYSGNYTLTQTATGASTNTIDAKGNAGTFSGVFSDAV
ncbi:MAG TPA: hypothetical protein VH189_05135, partial [Rhizomicrobium sp.]|nr:hypothetical protein [Rhizomicrobium sp.]